MKRANISYVSVGAFVLAMFTLLLIVLYHLTGRSGENDAYHVYYKNISGLTVGTPVTYEGFSLGHVHSIQPEQNGKGTLYRTDIRVRDGWRIPTDSIARIYTAGLLADIVIDIQEGSSTDFLTPGAEITGAESGDMFAMLNNAADDFSRLTEQSLKPLLENLNSRVDNIGGEVEETLPALLTDMKAITANLNQSSRHIGELLNNGNQQRLNEIIRNVHSSSEGLATLSHRFQKTQQALDRLLDQSNNLLSDNQSDIREAVLALKHSLDSSSQNVDSILINLDGASRNMYEFSRQIRQNPSLLLGGKPAQEIE